MSRSFASALLLLLCALALAACGGGGDDGGNDDERTDATRDAPKEQSTPAPDPADFPKQLIAKWLHERGGNVTFRDDGTYVGNDGCSAMAGTWSTEGVQMELEPREFEPVACVAPASLILLDDMEWEVAGDTLTLTRPEGSTFSLTRAEDVPTS